MYANAEEAQTGISADLLLNQSGMSRKVSLQNFNHNSYTNEQAFKVCSETPIDLLGWFSLQAISKEPFYGFAYSPTDWKANFSNALKHLNNLQSNQFNKAREKNTYTSREKTVLIEKVFFWLLLLLSMTLIWIERILSKR
jgi:hypothetical protein